MKLGTALIIAGAVISVCGRHNVYALALGLAAMFIGWICTERRGANV